MNSWDGARVNYFWAKELKLFSSSQNPHLALGAEAVIYPLERSFIYCANPS
jgi:hypothetical protein